MLAGGGNGEEASKDMSSFLSNRLKSTIRAAASAAEYFDRNGVDCPSNDKEHASLNGAMTMRCDRRLPWHWTNLARTEPGLLYSKQCASCFKTTGRMTW
jgi:hypothetical protein